jgi:hypothetical protein
MFEGSPRFDVLSSWLGHRSLACRYPAPFDTLAAITDTVIIEVIFKFVSNLAESGFPLEARVGIKAVRRFKQSTNSLSQLCTAGSEKPEVGWLHILPVGGCRETEFSGKVRPNPAHASHSQISSHRYYIINI